MCEIFYKVSVEPDKKDHFSISLDPAGKWAKIESFIFVYSAEEMCKQLHDHILKIKSMLIAINILEFKVIPQNINRSDIAQFVINEFIPTMSSYSNGALVKSIPERKLQDTQPCKDARIIISHIKEYGKNPDFTKEAKKSRCIEYIKTILGPHMTASIDQIYGEVANYMKQIS